MFSIVIDSNAVNSSSNGMTLKNLKKSNTDKIIKLSYLMFLERIANSEEIEYYNNLLNNCDYKSVKDAITSSDEYATKMTILFCNKKTIKKNKTKQLHVGSEDLSSLTPRSRQIYNDLRYAISIL